MPDEDAESEYTRFQSKIQLGDGVDRRGDIQVEIVRERAPPSELTAREVTLPSGETVAVGTDDTAFAEFYFEVQRKTDVLREQLGLDDGP